METIRDVRWEWFVRLAVVYDGCLLSMTVACRLRRLLIVYDGVLSVFDLIGVFTLRACTCLAVG